jgi:hypothetical protein
MRESENGGKRGVQGFMRVVVSLTTGDTKDKPVVSMNQGLYNWDSSIIYGWTSHSSSLLTRVVGSLYNRGVIYFIVWGV